MATLLTDLSIPVAPPTTLDAATPDVLPYVINGTTSEPSLGREITGWQSGVIPPAEQENWMRQKLWAWLGRASCTGFFTQRSTKAIAIGGALVAGDVIRMSYNGHNNDYTVTSQDVIDGFDTVAANWAQQITEDSAIRSSLDSQGSAFGNMLVFYRSPGVAFPHAVTVSVVSGTTTVSASDLYGGSAGPLLVTSAPSGGDGCTLYHAGPSLFGEDAATITTNAKTTANGKFIATGDAVDESVIALTTTDGITGSQLVPVAGYDGAVELVNGGSFDFTAKVIACDVATGQIVSTWRVDGTGYVSSIGVPTMQTLSATAPVTISATTRYVGVDVADWTAGKAEKFSDGGSFSLSVGFATTGSTSFLSLGGDGAIPGNFKATIDIRYITP